jgi:hypothetical protein
MDRGRAAHGGRDARRGQLQQDAAAQLVRVERVAFPQARERERGGSGGKDRRDRQRLPERDLEDRARPQAPRQRDEKLQRADSEQRADHEAERAQGKPAFAALEQQRDPREGEPAARRTDGEREGSGVVGHGRLGAGPRRRPKRLHGACR